MSKQRSASADRLAKARRAAVKELGLPPSSWQCKRFALLAIAHDNIQNRLAAGADISITNLLAVDVAMQAIRDSLPPPKIEVQIEIVDSDPLPLLPEPPSTPTPPSDETKLPAVAGDNVVPLRPSPAPAAKVPLHELPFNRPPLKKYQGDQSWRAHVASASGGYSMTDAGPRPNFEQGHALPDLGGRWDVLPR